MKPDISLFFPAYNERNNIKPLVSSAEKLLKEVAGKYEIILVCYAAATDGTPEYAKKLALKNPHLRIIIQPKSKPGVGVGYYTGMKAARYPCVMFADSDNQFDLSEFKKLLKFYPKYDLITGYKKKRQDPFMRVFTSKVYNILLRAFFDIGVRDADCAFKIYKKEITDRIRLTFTTGILVPELLIKARRLGYTFKEVPVTHFPRTAGDATYQTGAGFVKFQTVMNVIKDMIALKKELKKNWVTPSSRKEAHTSR
ncbi:MAG: glycosyltransferase family 2 protein [Nanoarchaeota archaeon]